MESDDDRNLLVANTAGACANLAWSIWRNGSARTLYHVGGGAGATQA